MSIAWLFKDQEEAEKIQEQAEKIVTETESKKKILECFRISGQKNLQKLGKIKVDLLANEVQNFLNEFGKIKNVDFGQVSDFSDINCSDVLKCIKDQVDFVSSSDLLIDGATGVAGGAAVGVLTAFGAYSAVGLLGTAGTGAAISGLSGVAATNATLAWLGGGTLASGGLGIAGGVAALTGIFLAPTLIGCWWYMGSKAEENLKNARENLAKANKFSADIKAAIILTEKINKIAEKAIFVLSELKEYLGVVLDQLKNVIKGQGINYDEYSLDAKQIVLTNVKIIQLIKAVLDTQILDKDDNLMGDSESNLLKIEDQINKLVGQKNYCLKQLPC